MGKTLSRYATKFWDALVDKAFGLLAGGFVVIASAALAFIWISIKSPIHGVWFYIVLGALAMALLNLVFAIVLVWLRLRRKLPKPLFSRLEHCAKRDAEWINYSVILIHCDILKIELDHELPLVQFNFYFINSSIFTVQFDTVVEGHIKFADRMLSATPTVVDGPIKGVFPGYKRCNLADIRLQQTLSKEEAQFITNADEDTAIFNFEDVRVYVSGGMEYPQVVRRPLYLQRGIRRDGKPLQGFFNFVVYMQFEAEDAYRYGIPRWWEEVGIR